MSAVAVVALVVTALMGVASTPPAEAATASNFDPGNIIDDSVFYNSSAMTAQQVQNFLNAKVSGCAAGYTCLKDYSMATPTKSAVANRCGAYAGAASESAATIIWKVAQACGINPQVLIVLLQKEQGLVTSTSPSTTRYRSATGYGCPDTAACDSTYYGFFNQVYQAAYAFKAYRANAGSFAYQAGRTNSILYNPNAACGRASVYIANQATAGLYIYTPYTPNAAAMSNLYGIGDGCSSYGNRNFWTYFTDWFGPTTADAHRPIGSLDNVNGGFGSISLNGWTIDPDTSDPIQVAVYVDNVGTAIGTASDGRADVGNLFPAAGPNHGFSIVVPATAGTHEVCVYALNVLAGTSNILLGCATASVASATPTGAITTVASVPGTGVRLAGWAVDPETAASIGIHIYADGTFLQAAVADQDSTGLPSNFASLGAKHGFDVTVAALTGQHTYCAYGLNVGYGTNGLLGCVSAVFQSGSPVGSLDWVSAVPGSIQVGGWAVDFDTVSSIPVHVYVDGRGTAIDASSARPDVGAVLPGYGDDHGFATQLPAAPGAHTVCAYGINTGPGNNTLLGCRAITVPGGNPFGSLDWVAQGPTSGSISLGGWAVDPDVTSSVSVDVYVDGVGAARLTADTARADVAAVLPGYGAAHGYAATFAVGAGTHTVCAYALNVGVGSNALLGCRSVTIS